MSVYTGKEYLQEQHRSCLHAWKVHIYDDNYTHLERRESASALLSELEILARRDFLRLKAEWEDAYEEDSEEEDGLDSGRYLDQVCSSFSYFTSLIRALDGVFCFCLPSSAYSHGHLLTHCLL